ncbi:hypothetical protein JCM11641_003549 [Rhodosporidiobolus odoratus]
MTTRQKVAGLGYKTTLQEPLLGRNFRVIKDLDEVRTAWDAWRNSFLRNLPDKLWKSWSLEAQQHAKAQVNALVTRFNEHKGDLKKPADLKKFLHVHRSDEVMQAIAEIQRFAYNGGDVNNGFMAWREAFLQKLQPWLVGQPQAVHDSVVTVLNGVASGLHSRYDLGERAGVLWRALYGSNPFGEFGDPAHYHSLSKPSCYHPRRRTSASPRTLRSTHFF